MNYFKHKTGMRNDPKVRQIMREYGVKGYGMLNLVYEAIAEDMDKSNKCHLTLPIKDWCELLRSRSEVAQKFLRSCLEVELLSNFQQCSEKRSWTCECSNLLKIKSEWSKRLGSDSVVTQEPLIESESESKSKSEDTPKGVSNARTALASGLVAVWNSQKIESWPVVNFETMNSKPKKTLTGRLWAASRNEDFDLSAIIAKASSVQFLQTGRFFCLLWLVSEKDGELNYKKVLSGKYTNSKSSSPVGKQRTGNLTPSENSF